MTELNNLGNKTSLWQVWEEYPNGGVEGDFFTIGSDKYYWNKIKRIWENPSNINDGRGYGKRIFDGDVITGNNHSIGGDAKVEGGITVRRNSVFKGRVWFFSTLYAKNVKQPNMGLFSTEEQLRHIYPYPKVGDWATVGGIPGEIWVCKQPGKWESAGKQGGIDPVELHSYVSKDEVLQACGTDIDIPMSQDAVTREILRLDSGKADNEIVQTLLVKVKDLEDRISEGGGGGGGDIPFEGNILGGGSASESDFEPEALGGGEAAL